MEMMGFIIWVVAAFLLGLLVSVEMFKRELKRIAALHAAAEAERKAQASAVAEAAAVVPKVEAVEEPQASKAGVWIPVPNEVMRMTANFRPHPQRREALARCLAVFSAGVEASQAMYAHRNQGMVYIPEIIIIEGQAHDAVTAVQWIERQVMGNRQVQTLDDLHRMIVLAMQMGCWTVTINEQNAMEGA